MMVKKKFCLIFVIPLLVSSNTADDEGKLFHHED